jgi:hypothetical protein
MKIMFNDLYQSFELLNSRYEREVCEILCFVNHIILLSFDTPSKTVHNPSLCTLPSSLRTEASNQHLVGFNRRLNSARSIARRLV